MSKFEAQINEDITTKLADIEHLVEFLTTEVQAKLA